MPLTNRFITNLFVANGSPAVATTFSSRASTLTLRLAMILAIAAVLLLGCDSAPKQPRRPASVSADSSSNEHLTQAIQQLTHLDEFEENAAAPEILYHLGQWLESVDTSASWEADPMMERLPAAIRAKSPLKQLQSLSFSPYDVKQLQEAYWFRDLSQWIATQPPRADIAAWAKARTPALSADEIDKLLKVDRYFDWIVRNIQLDVLLEMQAESATAPATGVPAAGDTKTAAGEAAASTVPDPVSWRGIPGPGYMYEPWQCLLYGHGDAWQRARLLILMARQQGIHVVMLATEDTKSLSRPRPWVPAAVIGKELFLFDTSLGLPIPDAGGTGIATLAEVVKQPELLSKLDVDDRAKYPVSATDLANVIAYLDASPAAASRRMSLLESSLVGADRAVLTTSPSALAKQLRQDLGINRSYIWPVPWEAPLYLGSLGRVVPPDIELVRAALAEQSMFQSLHPLVQGRHRQLRGVLEKQGDQEGATNLYMKARVPLAYIEKLDVESDYQKALGLVKVPGETEEDWRLRLEAAKNITRRSQNYASYWIGLAHYDLGNYSVAANWLDQLTLAVTPDGPWTTSARYNLARAYEADGKNDEARSIYLTDESPQRHGNILRARRLTATRP
ncbi:MAG: hypothetical protein RIS70_271 [Planctomycetota bacterium]